MRRRKIDELHVDISFACDRAVGESVLVTSKYNIYRLFNLQLEKAVTPFLHVVDGSAAIPDGVHRKLARENETDIGLDLAPANRRPPVCFCQLRSFPGKVIKDVLHERAHDRHGLGRLAELLG